MKSAGNDIVALQAIDIRRTNLPAFYSKIITPAEHALYSQPGILQLPFENFVWLLWSVKESAYKFLQRGDAGLIFSPGKIVVQNIVSSSKEFSCTGDVLYDSTRLYFQSKITDDFIVSVVNDEPDFSSVYQDVRKIEDASPYNQSLLVREFALAKLKTILGDDDLQIAKNEAGIPVVLNGGKQTDLPVSLAHHGDWVAYAFILNNRNN